MNDAKPDVATGAEIGIEEILQLIPHRPPFLLIDRAEDYRPHRSIIGIKTVSINEPWFVGHFPDHPVMPGVLVIEALAQSGGVLMSKSLRVEMGNKVILFMSVDHCRFRYPVRPGDVLRLHVEVARARGEVVKFRGTAMVADKIAAEAEFAAMLAELPA